MKRLFRLGQLAVALGALASASWAAATPSLSTLLTNGPTAQLLNIVFLADGYTEADERAFQEHAASVLGRFFETKPYREYRSYFNAFAIFTVSAQSGSDHPFRRVFRDTYFNSSFDSYGINRLLTIPPNDHNSNYSAGRGKVDALLRQLMPEYDLVILLVNDPEYGGSGGFPSVASINEASAEVALHEIGHTFAGLGDEYDTPYPGYPDTEEPNTTRQTARAQIKWRDWVLPSTPIPTPETRAHDSVVGLFEGAHFHSTGWYRPKLNCKMQSLGVDFCEVCSEAIVLAVYDRIDAIRSVSPTGPIRLEPPLEIELRVGTAAATGADLRFLWSIDGQPLPAATNASLTASSLSLGPGAHGVELEVRDATPLVRTDRARTLVERRYWQVTVADTFYVLGKTPQRLGDQLVLEFTASHPARMTLESSANLVDWSALRTESNSRLIQHALSAEGPPQFFRIVAERLP